MSEQDQAMQQRIRLCALRMARLRVVAELERTNSNKSRVWPGDITKAMLKWYAENKNAYDARAAEIIALEDAPL